MTQWRQLFDYQNLDSKHSLPHCIIHHETPWSNATELFKGVKKVQKKEMFLVGIKKYSLYHSSLPIRQCLIANFTIPEEKYNLKTVILDILITYVPTWGISCFATPPLIVAQTTETTHIVTRSLNEPRLPNGKMQTPTGLEPGWPHMRMHSTKVTTRHIIK